MDTPLSLQERLSEVFDKFNSELSTVSTEILNAKPKLGTWTIGQLAQHIMLGTAGLPDKKNRQPERAPDQFETSIREVFLNDKEKYESPAFMDPEKKTYQKEELLSKLKNNREVLLKSIKEEKLEFLCLDEEVTGWKYLTRYEWIKLIIYHMQRHTKQLKKLKASYGIPV